MVQAIHVAKCFGMLQYPWNSQISEIMDDKLSKDHFLGTKSRGRGLLGSRSLEAT